MRAGKSLAITVIGIVSALAGSHHAMADDQPRYDRKIEEAAIRRLQGKLGDFRGSIGLRTDGHIFPPLSMRLPEGEKSPWMLLNQPPHIARIVWG